MLSIIYAPFEIGCALILFFFVEFFSWITHIRIQFIDLNKSFSLAQVNMERCSQSLQTARWNMSQISGFWKVCTSINHPPTTYNAMAYGRKTWRLFCFFSSYIVIIIHPCVCTECVAFKGCYQNIESLSINSKSCLWLCFSLFLFRFVHGVHFAHHQRTIS